MDCRATAESFSGRLEIALQFRCIRKIYPLAISIGVDESAISRWRRGRPPSIENVVKLCDVLDLSVDWLLTGRGEMQAARRRPPDPGTTLTVELSRLPREQVLRLALIFSLLNELCVRAGNGHAGPG